MNIFLGRSQNNPQMDPAQQQNIQRISAGINKLLLQNVKLGDLLTGEIIDSLQKHIKVLLPDGTIFEALLEHPLDLYIGQEVTLEVKDIQGKQIHMEMAIEANPQQETNKGDINNILKQLDLPITDGSQEAVKSLMQKMLPITKDHIKQIEFGLKSSQLSISSLLSMLENEIPITPNSLSQVQGYENGEIKLQGQLERLIENLLQSDNFELLDQVETLLSEIKQSSKQMSHQSPVSQQAELIEDNQVLDKAILANNKLSFELQEELGKTVEAKELNLDQLYNKDISLVKKEIADIFKELFFIDPNKLKDKNETKLQEIKELYKEIYKLADKLEKLEEAIPGKEKTRLYADIKSNIEFLSLANKYDTMIHIPLVMQNQYKHGELYIFNKKKTGKKSYNEASMLISLETNTLGTVEIYVKKYNKQISVQFKTQDMLVETIIKHQVDLLKNGLKNKGYDLTGVSYIPSDEAFVSQEEVKKDLKPGRYRFDTKA